jgi:hypothetical protein
MPLLFRRLPPRLLQLNLTMSMKTTATTLRVEIMPHNLRWRQFVDDVQPGGNMKKERRVNPAMRAVVSLASQIGLKSKFLAAVYCQEHRVPVGVALRVIAGKTTASEKTGNPAINAYDDATARVMNLVHDLIDHVNLHRQIPRDRINFGHVGDMNRIANGLRDLLPEKQ